MHLMTLGVNHKSASIGLREQLAISSESVIATLNDIMDCAHVKAVVVISTCNRTEIYLQADSIQAVLRRIKRQSRLKLRDLKQSTYLYVDRDAVTHLMQVASGLDSMVLGEVEILGQIKAAYQLALKHGCVTKSLSRLFQHAFSVAKRVRTQTNIGLNPVSVAYLAVRLAERIFARLSEQTALVIGAGDTARLVIKHLASAGVKCFYLANRTISRSQALVAELSLVAKVELLDLGEIPGYLMHADIVVAATSSPLPIIGKGMVEQALRARKHKPMFMIDLAVPRDIEDQVREIADVYLYAIDDLQAIAAEHKRYRLSAVSQADPIIKQEADKFMAWIEGQQAISTIHAFRQNCVDQRDQALHEAQRQLESGRDPNIVLQRFAHVLLNRLIHQPTVQMRVAASEGNTKILAAARQLFNLEKEYESIDS